MAVPPALPYHPRPQALQRLRRAVQQHARVVLAAPRGHGKSALVEHELAPALQAQGWKLSTIHIASPTLPALLDDLRRIASAGDAEALAALCDHGGAPAHQQVAQALAWLADSSRQPHLLVLENAHRLAEPGNNRLVGAMQQALRGLDGPLRVLFTVSSRVAMEELFNGHAAPFRHAACSVHLGGIGEDFIPARARQLAGHGLAIDSAELADCLRRQAGNLGCFERIVHCLLEGHGSTLAAAELHCRRQQAALP